MGMSPGTDGLFPVVHVDAPAAGLGSYYGRHPLYHHGGLGALLPNRR